QPAEQFLAKFLLASRPLSGSQVLEHPFPRLRDVRAKRLLEEAEIEIKGQIVEAVLFGRSQFFALRFKLALLLSELAALGADRLKPSGQLVVREFLPLGPARKHDLGERSSLHQGYAGQPRSKFAADSGRIGGEERRRFSLQGAVLVEHVPQALQLPRDRPHRQIVEFERQVGWHADLQLEPIEAVADV